MQLGVFLMAIETFIHETDEKCIQNWAGKLEQFKPQGRPTTCTREGNVMANLKIIRMCRCESAASDSGQVLINAEMNRQIPEKMGNFLTS